MLLWHHIGLYRLQFLKIKQVIHIIQYQLIKNFFLILLVNILYLKYKIHLNDNLKVIKF